MNGLKLSMNTKPYKISKKLGASEGDVRQRTWGQKDMGTGCFVPFGGTK